MGEERKGYDGLSIVEIIENSFNIDVKEISYFDKNNNTHIKIKTIDADDD